MGKQPAERYKGAMRLYVLASAVLMQFSAVAQVTVDQMTCAQAQRRPTECAYLRQVTSRAASRISNLVNMDHAVLRGAAADLASDVRDPRWSSMHSGLHVRCVWRRVALAGMASRFPISRHVSAPRRSTG